MKQIEKININQLLQSITNETTCLYVALPSIDNEIAKILVEKSSGIKINLLIDNSEDVIRNGFGDINGLEQIMNSNIKTFQSNGNLISFIIADDIGYFIFPHSKLFLENATGNNAFKIDPLTQQLLIQYFFKIKNEEVNNSIDYANYDLALTHFNTALKEINDVETVPEKIDKKNYEIIKERILNNPPLEPDLKRIINTYSAKIQFVELKFTGVNISNKKASIPQNILPVNNSELNELLQTRINMFQNIENTEDYKKLKDIKDNIEKLRKIYLKPISSRNGKSIIKLEKKEAFKNEIENIKKEVEKLNRELTTLLEASRQKTISLLKDALKNYYDKNPPENVKAITQQEIRDNKIQEIINGNIIKIRLAEVSKLLDKISINVHFFDLTWEDFNNPKFLDELVSKKIMVKDEVDSIVKMKKAIDVKKMI